MTSDPDTCDLGSMFRALTVPVCQELGSDLARCFWLRDPPEVAVRVLRWGRWWGDVLPWRLIPEALAGRP